MQMRWTKPHNRVLFLIMEKPAHPELVEGCARHSNLAPFDVLGRPLRASFDKLRMSGICRFGLARTLTRASPAPVLSTAYRPEHQCRMM
jgi:hypothetical protein